MKTSRIVVPIIALLAGLAGGYGIAQLVTSHEQEPQATVIQSEEAMSGAAASPSPMASDAHADAHAETGEMGDMHEPFVVSAAEAPSVSLRVEEDAKSGWNVTVATEEFAFTPEDVNGENVVGEGHAHLYVDGEKVARLYGPYFHYPVDFDGTKTFRVTLNANDHSEYTVDGQPVEATVKVTHDHHE
jgi:hypothetical protein